MNSKKIRIIFKENFEFQVEFPSVEIHMQFMDRILQDISENLSPLCYTNNNLFYFYAWKAFAP